MCVSIEGSDILAPALSEIRPEALPTTSSNEATTVIDSKEKKKCCKEEMSVQFPGCLYGS